MRSGILSGTLLGALLFSPGAFAAGWGFSVNGGWERWVSDTTAKETHIRDTSSVHLIFDPRFDNLHLTANPVLLWRMMLGYESSRGHAYNGLSFTGLSFTNNLAFRLARDEGFRFWLGPRFRVLELSAGDHKQGVDYSGDILGLGVGAVMGLDFFAHNRVGYSISAGVTRTSYWGYIDEYSGGSWIGEIDIDHRANAWFVDLAVIFMSR